VSFPVTFTDRPRNGVGLFLSNEFWIELSNEILLDASNAVYPASITCDSSGRIYLLDRYKEACRTAVHAFGTASGQQIRGEKAEQTIFQNNRKSSRLTIVYLVLL